MFGIFKGENAAMLNLECKESSTTLSKFRLRNFSKHINYGFLNVSVNRTVPSELFGWRQNAKKRLVFSRLEMET